jgi:ABC-2 type transport system permease protein
MQLDVARLELLIRRRLLLWFTIGIGLYMLVIVALYPAFRHSTELNQLTQENSPVAALLGATGPLTSPAGWLNVNAYANFLPLIMLLLTIGYAASTIAGQNEDGTLGLIVILPATRTRILTGKIASLTAQAALLTITVAACVYIGRAFQVSLDPWHVATASLAIMGLGIDFGLLALAIGAATGSRGTTIAAATALAVVSYLISSLAPVVGLIQPLRYASLFYWATGNSQLSQGAGLATFAVLVAVAAAGTAAARAAFTRLDVR